MTSRSRSPSPDDIVATRRVVCFTAELNCPRTFYNIVVAFVECTNSTFVMIPSSNHLRRDVANYYYSLKTRARRTCKCKLRARGYTIVSVLEQVVTCVRFRFVMSWNTPMAFRRTYLFTRSAIVVGPLKLEKVRFCGAVHRIPSIVNVDVFRQLFASGGRPNRGRGEGGRTPLEDAS